MTHFVDLDQLGQAQMLTEPYPHLVYDGAFGDEANARTLFDEFPDSGFDWQIEYKIDRALGATGPKALRHAKRMRILVDADNREPIRPEDLSPAWRRVTEDILDPAYRDVVSDVTGVDVRRTAMLAHFWRFSPGSWFRPHIDKPHKVVTQLFFFGDGWRREWGGCLRLLRSGCEHDVQAEYTPALNRSVVHIRTDNAWHAVSDLAVGCPQERLVFQVWFQA
jgi:hypothetical protein